MLRATLRNLDLDKYLITEGVGEELPPKNIDSSFIEYAIIRLFYIDVMEHIKLLAVLSKEFHIAPSELDKLPYWEFEYWIQQLNEIVKEENDRQKSEMDKYHVSEHMNATRPGNMQKMMSAATPKIPAMPSFGSMPTPKF